MMRNFVLGFPIHRQIRPKQSEEKPKKGQRKLRLKTKNQKNSLRKRQKTEKPKAVFSSSTRRSTYGDPILTENAELFVDHSRPWTGRVLEDLLWSKPPEDITDPVLAMCHVCSQMARLGKTNKIRFNWPTINVPTRRLFETGRTDRRCLFQMRDSEFRHGQGMDVSRRFSDRSIWPKGHPVKWAIPVGREMSVVSDVQG